MLDRVDLSVLTALFAASIEDERDVLSSETEDLANDREVVSAAFAEEVERRAELRIDAELVLRSAVAEDDDNLLLSTEVLEAASEELDVYLSLDVEMRFVLYSARAADLEETSIEREVLTTLRLDPAKELLTDLVDAAIELLVYLASWSGDRALLVYRLRM